MTNTPVLERGDRVRLSDIGTIVDIPVEGGSPRYIVVWDDDPEYQDNLLPGEIERIYE